ncbi:MAG: 4-(cytidine 5'-diphospho)-2-C-methyl-D-erythritol kinase [Rhodobacteraceae bacterium]|nr:MAG: 4-(cytidine 5'-diphospho)-2-C-methyl-D-erythritol kinase [Paracoccaceae bacterium]
MTAAEPARALARAKVNLFLHVRGRRPDGRHTLESLAVFPDVGDVVTAEPSAARSLSLSGPFAIGLGAGDDNLALRAVEALGEALGERRGLALHLEKRLPIASGIGGGSADAAAALRLALRVWGRTISSSALAHVALGLGADVPVCLSSEPAVMGGVGETLTAAPAPPPCWMVLVNPGQPLSTAAVFAALDRRDNPPGPRTPARFADVGALVSWLATTRNDLEAPARRLAPSIGAALGALRWTPGCLLARMSGSGATCFGLFADEAAATDAAAAIRNREPAWWVAPAQVSARADETV